MLPQCEMLLEAEAAAGKRVAPCVDDLRIGQGHQYQAEVHEIIRHLVDEEGLAQLENVAVVAMANKMARTIWALLAHERAYQSGYVSRLG
jgi:hypothetical protein